MRIFPSNSQEWINAFLRPFKVYTFLGIFLFQIVLAAGQKPGADFMAHFVAGLYVISILIFLFGALIQMRFKQRRAGYITLLFVLANIFIIFMMVPYFNRA
jgi:O-antigen/teichoic acid export membrane protein